MAERETAVLVRCEADLGVKSLYDQGIEALSRFFSFILRDEAGLLILLGTMPAPTSYDIYRMKSRASEDLGCHVDGGEKAQLADVVIDATKEEYDLIASLAPEGERRRAWSAGWERIHRSVREFKQRYPDKWQYVEEYALFIRPGGLLHDGRGGMAAQMAEKNDGVCQRTLRRQRERILRCLARYVMSWHEGDQFRLRG